MSRVVRCAVCCGTCTHQKGTLVHRFFMPRPVLVAARLPGYERALTSRIHLLLGFLREAVVFRRGAEDCFAPAELVCGRRY